MIFGAIHSLTSRIKSPVLRIGLEVVAVVIFLTIFFSLMNRFSSCGYHQARQEYEQKETQLKEQRDKAIGSAEEKEKQSAELQPKVDAYESLGEQGKKLDEATVNKINEVSKQYAEEQAHVQDDVDCRTRAAGVCNRYRAAGVGIDCAVFTARECGQQH